VVGVDFQNNYAADISVDTTRPYPQPIAVTGNPLTNYTKFALIDNLYFVKRSTIATGNPVRAYYMPKDELSTTFFNIGNGTAVAGGPDPTAVGYGGFYGYVSGAQASAACVSITVVMNFECQVVSSGQDFIPSAPYAGIFSDLEEVRTAINRTPKSFLGGTVTPIGGGTVDGMQPLAQKAMNLAQSIVIPNNPAVLKQKVPWYRKMWTWVKKAGPVVGKVLLPML